MIMRVVVEGIAYEINDGQAEVKGVADMSAINVDEYFMIPETVNDCPVVGIGDEAFSHSLIKYIKLPSTVTYIGVKAFSHSEIREILFAGDLPDIPVIEIYKRAFEDCDYLQKFFPWQPVALAEEALYGCISLDTLHNPICAVYLDSQAFSCCWKVKYIIMTSCGLLRKHCLIMSDICEIIFLDDCHIEETADAYREYGVQLLALPGAKAFKLAELGFTISELKDN